jgi:hypothetical protein
MRNILFIALAAGLAFAAPQAGAQHNDHHQAAATAPVPAQRYATDAPLREHMGGIRTAVAALEHGEHGHLDAAQVRTLAEGIQAHVRGIVAECKLPPDADAVLHGIIAPLAANAEKLKADPQAAGAIMPMRAALEVYDASFDEAPVAE